MKDLKIVAIIPARGGSKGVPLKNIKLLNGKPLISYAISAALKSKYIGRVIVSTDHTEIARIAKIYKAEVPFLRPARLSGDNSTTLSVLKHAVSYLEKNLGSDLDLIVLIQPTSPLSTVEDIDEAIKKMNRYNANSCVSVCEITDRPEWMVSIKRNSDNILRPYLNKQNRNSRRQSLPKIFRLNGAIYVMKRDILMKKNKIIDYESCTSIIMPLERSVDIDRPLDFWVAETIMKRMGYNSLVKKYDT